MHYIEYHPELFHTNTGEKQEQWRHDDEQKQETMMLDLSQSSTASKRASQAKESNDNLIVSANPKRKLTIWSWGRNVHEDPQCDLTVDLAAFRSEYERRDIRKADGQDPEIQEMMESHPDFPALMQLVIQVIEDDHNDVASVAFVCSWGKHRSMAFAEILRRDYYRRSKLKHARFLQVEEQQERDRKKPRKPKRGRLKRF